MSVEIWYQVSMGRIWDVQVLSYTEHTVSVRYLETMQPMERKRRVKSDEGFFPTEAEAIAFLVGMRRKQLAKAERAYRIALGQLEYTRARWPDAPEWATPADGSDA